MFSSRGRRMKPGGLGTRLPESLVKGYRAICTYRHGHGTLWCWDVTLAAVTGDLAEKVCDVLIIWYLLYSPDTVGTTQLVRLRISEMFAFQGLNYTAVMGIKSVLEQNVH